MIYSDIGLIPPATVCRNLEIVLRAPDGSVYTARSSGLAWVPTSKLVCSTYASLPSAAAVLPGTSAFVSGTSTEYINSGTAWLACVRADSSGNVLLSGAGVFGYDTGSGGSVTQLTSKTTAVTLNAVNGEIVMSNSSMTATSTSIFTLNNSLILNADYTVNVHRKSGGTDGTYIVWCDSVTGGSCVIAVRNQSASAKAEAVVLHFAICRGASS